MKSTKKNKEQNDILSGKVFTIFIQTLILFSIVAFSIETLPNLSSQTSKFLNIFEIICVIIFSTEYLLRIYFAPQKLKFIFSFFGLIDLLAILPFYLSTGIDLRSIRIFRMFRLFRIFKIFRYSKALNRLALTFKIIKEELIVFLIATFFILYISAIGIYYFEHAVQPKAFASVFHSLWWAIGTLTTVGYGDIYPITAGGKIFTFIMLIVGLGIIAVPTGLIASALTKIIAEEKNKK